MKKLPELKSLGTVTQNGMTRHICEDNMTPQQQKDELLLIAHQEDCEDLGVEPLS